MRVDAVVIGAGISGLSCGAFLAKAGRSVVVIERAERPGGYFNSFQYNGYHFDGGIKAVENAGLLLPMMQSLGLEKRVNFMKNRMYAGLEDKLFLMDSDEDISAYFDYLGNLFPDSKTGLGEVLAEMMDLTRVMEVISDMSRPLYKENPILSKLKSAAWFMKNGKRLMELLKKLKYNEVLFREFLQERIKDEELINIIDEPFFYGTPAFFGLAYPTVFRDYYYPEGGISKIPDVLTECITENGGIVKLNTEVVEIKVSNGRAVGVVTSTGQEISAGSIINAADARKLYTKLLPKETVSSDFLTRLARATVSDSVFSIFLGVDSSPEDLDHDVAHVIYVPAAAKPVDYSSPEYFETAGMEISIPCLRDRKLAPEGKTGIILNLNSTQEFSNGWGKKVSREAYESIKEKAADQVMENFFKLYPSLRDKIEFRLVATPFTMERKTLNSGGSISGWSYHPDETFPFRDFKKMNKSILTPVKSLYQVGQWSFDPAGVPVCLITAKVAADRAQKK